MTDTPKCPVHPDTVAKKSQQIFGRQPKIVWVCPVCGKILAHIEKKESK